MTRPPSPRSSGPAADDARPSTSRHPDPGAGPSPVRRPDPADRADDPTVGPAATRPLAGDEPSTRRRLPSRVVACWRWALAAASVPPLVLLVALAVLLPDDLPLVVGAAWLLAALVAVGTGAAVVVVPPIRHAVFWYALSDSELDVGHGIVFRRRTVVPMQRVQSLRTERGPLARWFRLTNVRVRTAAGSVVINGLDEAEADRVCALISRLADVRDDV